jgi:quercetin dioxygenase-like cupin family protein
MKIVKLTDGKPEEAASKMFEGKVYRLPLIDNQIAKEITVTMIMFNPGARNVFHTHTGEQVLYVTDGKGIVANEQEEFTVTQGTAIYIPPGERHWHGATEDSSFSHLSILRPGETKF